MAAHGPNSQIYITGSTSEDSSDSLIANNPSMININQFSQPLSVFYNTPSNFSNSYLPITNAMPSSEVTPTLNSEQANYTPQFLAPVSMQPFNYTTPPCLDAGSSSINQNVFVPSSQTSYASCAVPQDNVNSWVYSSSGFDLLGILSKVINRPNPQINLGPVDLSCAFLVVDARKYDFPIVYASESFEKLTGYNNMDVSGKNCRFLQSPDGLVTLGSRRRYTDNNAVHQIKSSMLQAKESQVSIVNYRKNGQPFINLITIIPVTLGDTIAYYVGFQVDLVEQPNSIMDKMKDGTYSVNYSNLTLPNYLGTSLDDSYQRLLPSIQKQNEDDVYELVTGKPGNDDSHRELNKLLIESSEFIHVLTLKGIFLYASPSSFDIFGYPNNALMGHSISKICHPNDMIPIMRELKDSVTSADMSFNLTYRIQRTSGGYIWIESVGKLHSDSIKGKRFMVLNGRVRPSYCLPRSLITSSEPFHPDEFWCKVSKEGLFLFVSKSCQQAIGYTSEELLGTSINSLVLPDYTSNLAESLQQTQDEVKHLVIITEGKTSQISLNSFFYPGPGGENFVLCRFRPISNASSTSASSSPSSFDSGSSFSYFGSIEENNSGNLLDIIDPNRSTTWQYELHQLQTANHKLRQEIESLTSKMTSSKKLKRKHPRTKSLICYACNRTESPEWRRGPNGPKTLCNPCGIKYAKKVSLSRNIPKSQPMHQLNQDGNFKMSPI